MGDAVSHVSSKFLDDLKEILALFRWLRDSPEEPALPKRNKRLWAKARKQAKQELDESVTKRMKQFRGSVEPPTGTLPIHLPKAERQLRNNPERMIPEVAEPIYRELDTNYAEQAGAAETDFRDKQERLDHLLTIHKDALLAHTAMGCTVSDREQLWDKLYLAAASTCFTAEPYQAVVIKELVVMIAKLEDTSHQQPDQVVSISEPAEAETVKKEAAGQGADLRADEPTGLPDDFTDVVGLPADMATILQRGDFPTLSDDEYAKLGAWLSANARKVYGGMDPANVAKTQRMEEAKKRLRAINEYNTTLRQQTGNGSGPALKIQNRANATGQSIVQQTIINPKGNVAGINTGDMTCEDKSGADPKKKSWLKDHFVGLFWAVLGAVIAALIVALLL